MNRIHTKLFIVPILLLIVCSLFGCRKKSAAAEPDISQIRSICDLATLDCYYHNVAKSEKDPGDGISHIGEKQRKFWIEYTGVMRLGIDMSKVNMTVNGENIKISIPEAEVLGERIDQTTLNEDSYIASDDGFNKNKISAKNQTDAINEAQDEMEKTVKDNSALLLSAQNRAQMLIENYINQLGKASGIDYNITWVFSDGHETTETTAAESSSADNTN